MIKRLTYFISLLILPSIPLAQHSLSFDGVNDYVQMSSGDFHTFDVNEDFTIQTWMKSNNSSQNQGIIENGYSFVSNGYALRKYPDGKIWFHTNIFSVSSLSLIHI